jgi:hypothetical protein
MIARKSNGPESSGATALRQRVGNQGIQRLMAERAESDRAGVAALLRSLPIQTKLTFREPGDAHEREADHVADAVMRMPAKPGAEKGAWQCCITCDSTRGGEHPGVARRR